MARSSYSSEALIDDEALLYTFAGCSVGRSACTSRDASAPAPLHASCTRKRAFMVAATSSSAACVVSQASEMVNTSGACISWCCTRAGVPQPPTSLSQRLVSPR